MSMQSIRDRYGVPAKRGGRIRYTGGKRPRMGTIVSAHGHYLTIQLDGARRPGVFHPAWEMEYLEGHREANK